MKTWMVAALMGSLAFSSIVAVAKDQQSDDLATRRREAALKTAASHPASEEFPTPAELVKRMKKIEKEKAALAKVAFFNLNRPIQEKAADFSLFGDDGSLTLRLFLSGSIRRGRTLT